MKNSKNSFSKYIRIWSNRNRKTFRIAKETIFSTSRGCLMSVGLFGFIIGSPGAALAATLPTGADVIHGQIELQNPSSDALRIIQSSQSAIVNWQSFDIGHGALVDVVQPNIDAAMLSRVVGSNLSEIHGSLNANGHLYLINPNGIIFGSDAQIDVHALIASSLDIADSAFLSGNISFDGDSEATIMNLGSIKADEFAALIGGAVQNDGTIAAPGGDVALLSGDAVLEVGEAAGGKITLDLSGLLGGSSMNSGSIDVSSLTTKGGGVVVVGDELIIDGIIDATGVGGGGRVLIGGDYQGNNQNLTNAQNTRVSGSISADAIENGDGGNVIIWSDGDTQFSGSITAKGATEGVGGFAEVSGKENLVFSGAADLSGPNGGGKLLLDPTDITVAYSGTPTPSATLAGAGDANGNNNLETGESSGVSVTINPAALTVILHTGTDVTLQATNDIIIDGAVAKTDGGDAVLTLVAGNDINVNQTLVGGVGKLGVVLNASGDVLIGNTIQTNGGVFTSSGVNFTQNSPILTDSTSANGDVSINHTGTVAINDNIGTSGSLSGAVSVAGVGGISLGGDVYSNGQDITFSQPVSLTKTVQVNSGSTSAGNVSFANTINGAYGLTAVAGTGDITFSGIVGGTSSLTSFSASGNDVSLPSIGDSDTVGVSGVTSLEASNELTLSGDTYKTNAATYTSGSGQKIKLTVGSDVTFNSNSQNVEFATGDILLSDGSNLIVNAAAISTEGIRGSSLETISLTGTGAVSLGAMGNAGEIGDVSVSGSSIESAGITTSGGNISMNSGSGSGNIRLGGSIDTTGNSVATAGTVALTSATLGLTADSSIITDAVSTDQVISLPASVTDGGTNPSLTLDSGSANVTLYAVGATDNAIGSLTVSEGATVAFNGNIEASSVEVAKATTVTLANGVSIDTNSGNFTLAADTITDSGVTLVSTSGSTGIATLKGSTDSTTIGLGTGTGDLSLSETFLDKVPATFATIQIGGSGQTGAVTLNDSDNSITFANTGLDIYGPVSVAANMTLDTSSGNNPITIQSTIDGAYNLSLTAGSGNVYVGGTIGGSTALTALTFTGADLTLSDIGDSDTVGVSGATSATATDELTLSGSTYKTNAATFASAAGDKILLTNGSAITFTTTDDAIAFNTGNVKLSDGSDLSVTSAGGAISAVAVYGTSSEDIALSSTGGTTNTVSVGTVGSADQINTVAITGSSGITLSGNIVTSDASGNTVTLTGPVTLGGAVSIDTDNTTNDGAVSFSSTIDGAQTLAISSGSANTSVAGAIGGTTKIASFSIPTANDVSLQAVTTAASGTITLGTDSSTRIDGILTLAGNLSTDNGDDSAAGVLSIYADNVSLNHSSSGGTITLDSDGSSDGAITIVTDTANSGTLSSATAWDDGITITSGTAVSDLSGASFANLNALSVNAASVTLGATATGDGGLSLTSTNGNVTLNGDLATTGETNAGSVTISATSGTIALGGNISVSTDSVSGTDQTISLGSITDGATDPTLTLDAGSQNVTLADVGTSANAIGALTIVEAGTVNFNGDVETNGIDVQSATSVVMASGKTLDANTGNLSLASDGLTDNGLIAVLSTGASSATATFKGKTVATTIGIGAGAAGSSTLDLSEAFLDKIDNFATVVIGDAAQTGVITLDDNGAFDLANTGLTINAAGTNGSFVQTSDTSLTLSGSAKALAINGDGDGTNGTTFAADVITNGGSITIDDKITLGGAVTIDSTNSGGTAAGANVAINSTSGGATIDGAQNLTIKSGSAGAILRWFDWCDHSNWRPYHQYRFVLVFARGHSCFFQELKSNF